VTELRAGSSAGWRVVVALSIGYIGLYLCRKNLSVAIPLLQTEFHASKEEVGAVASVGTVAYAIGKIVNGAIVDRVGGRIGFIGSLTLVALFGAAGAFSPTLGVLSIVYGLNRFAGAGGWPAMVKLIPSWFGVTRSATVFALMSLSYVFGGVAAVLFARQVVASGGGWRAVMGVPAIALVVIAVITSFWVRAGDVREDPNSDLTTEEMSRWRDVKGLLKQPRFLLACAVSFDVTLMRESLNVWAVDFLTVAQGKGASVASAALHSIGFDLAGAIAILVNGVLYDRVDPKKRGFLMAANLILLALALFFLPVAGEKSLLLSAALIGLVGLLVYGPYSLLSGVIAVETGGHRVAATASGVIDGIGYFAAVLAGAALGRLLDIGGYPLGFRVLAGVTLMATVLALGLRGGTDARLPRPS
jgi:MFS transporter, OPA family, glycerol-3-phosphate transporter